MSWPDQLSTQQKCLLRIVYSFLTQGSLAWLASRWSDSSFFSPQQFVRDLVNFHEPQHELYHLTMRDSSFRERPESDKHWEKKKEEEKKGHENGKQCWHFQQVYLRPWQWALGKEMASLAGAQMGGGYTKGVVKSRHGMSKPPCFFSGVWKIKEDKIWLFYSPDPWTQWCRVKTLPGNNLYSHYLNPLKTRTAGHAPGPMFHHEMKRGFLKCFI